MTKIKMLATAQGSPDGLRTHIYAEGQVYDLPDALVAAFFQSGVCEMVTDDPMAPKSRAVKQPPRGRA